MSLILKVNQKPSPDRVDRVALCTGCAGEDVVVEVVDVDVEVVVVLPGNSTSPRMITVAPGAGL